MSQEDIQALIDKAAKGDPDAIRALRTATKGQFEAKKREDIPPFLRPAYEPPEPRLPKSLEELRAKREYSRAVVDQFVNTVCSSDFMSPGAAMFLFVLMCTKFHSAFREFGGEERRKLMAMYRFWDESHPWVRANILFEMRVRLYEEQHLKFCQAFAAKAREYDKIVEAERAAADNQEVTNEQGQNERDEP